jgi:YD repeat-containing protein
MILISKWPAVRRHRRAGLTALAAGAALLVGVPGAPVQAPAAAVRALPPAASPGKAVPVTAIARHAVPIPRMSPAPKPSAAWPAGGSATLDVASATAAHPTSAKAGGLTLTLVPAAGTAETATAGSSAATVSPVQVQVATQSTSKALGIHGVVLSLTSADADANPGQVDLAVDYAGFADGYGGSYGSRLELVQLPACALTTPKVATCLAQSALGSSNNTRTQTVSAAVTLSGATAATATTASGASSAGGEAAMAKPAVLAIVAGPAGSAGDFAAQPASEETNDWVTGANSGDYTYDYPITVPSVPGGLEPVVDLGYDSGAAMGLNASTNDEPSWIGDGWDYSPGYIEFDYPACDTVALMPQTEDLCDDGKVEATLSLGGTSTPLVDGASGWRAESDGGASVVETNNTWEVIEPNGDQLYFGLNDVPGYAAGDASMNAQWDAPVWEGCGQAAFCTVPWRAMLSYEVDSHGDAIAYSYSTETNSYAEANGTVANGTYTQGGALSTISYGFRAGQYYTSTPAAQVQFTVAATRQDAPTDLSCAAGAACPINAPTFWSPDQLTGISTSTLENGSMQPVDSWALTGTYPATGDPTSAPELWLSSITHTGQDGASPITLPPTTFAGTPLPNRVETAADSAAGYSEITRFYLSSVTNETGGVTGVSYTSPYSGTSFPAPSANTSTVYPDYWIPEGSSSQVQDWFDTYAATSVTRTDTTGDDPPVVTDYTYAAPAWHYNGETVSRSATVTWDQWRGYRSVTIETGTAPDAVTETVTAYLQGMSQDGPPGSLGPVVTFTTSRGQSLTDSDQFAGMPAESIVYDGAGSGRQVTDTVTASWTSSATAVDTLLDQSAYLTGVGSTETYTALADGGVREAIVSYSYGSDGLTVEVSDVPDTSNASESTCTATKYDPDTATGLLNLPETVSTVTGPCGSEAGGSGALVSETEYFYDGGGLGAAPTAGNVTKTGKAVSGSVVPVFDTSASTYDEYGRVLTSANPDNETTTTAYTPATGAEPTSVKVADPMGLATSTTYDPARNLALTVTAPDGTQTTTAYDALGRESAAWTAGNPDSGLPDTEYSYSVSDTAPSVSTTETEQPGGGYLTSESIYDSFDQIRETQSQTSAGGSAVTDTAYDSDGWKSLVSNPYYISAPPSGTLVSAAADALPSQGGYEYDGDGRVTREIAYADGVEAYEQDTTYGGNYVTVVPPAGGVSTTTFTDGRGLAVAVDDYHAGVPASPSDPATDYDQTSYTYTPGGQLAKTKDAAGNLWTDTYNLLGQQLTQAEPDAGTTTSSYDSAGQLISSTDTRGKTISFAYDLDGRKVAEYDTTGGAAETSSDEIAAWSYDTLAKGKLTSSSSYVNGAAYTEQVTGYNAYDLPEGLATVIPAAQGALAGTYTQTYTYAPTGEQISYTDQAAGALPAETVATGYNSAGQPDSLTGANSYVDQLSYTDLGQPLQYQENSSTAPVYVTDSYDPETGAPSSQDTQIGSADTSVNDVSYSYNDVGDLTSEADTPAGDPAAVDQQCFEYDYLGRIVEAWAQGTAGCAATPSASVEGGAAPYLESYTYAATGQVTGETSTTPAGAVTTTVDSYPAAGAAQPHALSSQAVTTSTGTTVSGYTYNADGQLTGVAGATQNQSLTWNDSGQLSGVSTTLSGGSAQQTTSVYGANGDLLLTSDPGSTTLYLADEELSYNVGTATMTGTRYYSIGGLTVATRTGADDPAYLAGDEAGTLTVAIDSQTLDITRRYYDPYGNPRGAAPAGFPTGEVGFSGGTGDAATGLIDLSNREYQRATESYVAPGSTSDPSDPLTLDPYAEATGNQPAQADSSGAAAAGATAGAVPGAAQSSTSQQPDTGSAAQPSGGTSGTSARASGAGSFGVGNGAALAAGVGGESLSLPGSALASTAGEVTPDTRPPCGDCITTGYEEIASQLGATGWEPGSADTNAVEEWLNGLSLSVNLPILSIKISDPVVQVRWSAQEYQYYKNGVAQDQYLLAVSASAYLKERYTISFGIVYSIFGINESKSISGEVGPTYLPSGSCAALQQSSSPITVYHGNCWVPFTATA